MEKPRYVYNPFLLNVLYQKVIYLEKIRRLFLLSRSEEDENKRLIKENYYSELIVADIFHQTETLGKGKFPLDVYFCNYEFILFRMYNIFHASDGKVLPHDLVLQGGLFTTELLCLEMMGNGLEEKDNKKVMGRLVERYILKYYFLD